MMPNSVAFSLLTVQSRQDMLGRDHYLSMLPGSSAKILRSARERWGELSPQLPRLGTSTIEITTIQLSRALYLCSPTPCSGASILTPAQALEVLAELPSVIGAASSLWASLGTGVVIL